MALCVMAVSAPQNLRSFIGEYVLKSQDPVSLYNACRFAGLQASKNVGAWGKSNWSGARVNRKNSMLLMHSFEEDVIKFKEMLMSIRPNLLFIGAMTICLPGAIACAKIAKEILGDKVCIVLGGRHTSESIYLDKEGSVNHHVSSPLLLMERHQIDRVFDLVISGEGEYITAWIGEIVNIIDKKESSFFNFNNYFQFADKVPGKWIMGSMRDDKIHICVSKNIPIDKNDLPSPCEIFGINSSFNIFEDRITAHVHSDISNGCIFNCNFCSEGRDVSATITQMKTGSDRLFRQMQSAVKVVNEDSPNKKVSAFIEDSTILTGSIKPLREFISHLKEYQLDIKFGGQFTIDQISSKVEILSELKKVGLDYIFIGIETFDPKIIGGMSKDIKNTKYKWIDRVEKSIEILKKINIKCGAAILFGMGESHESRIKLFQKLKEWKQKYNSPDPISINWAVQHPLRGNDGGANYNYIDWAIPTNKWLKVFNNFGEASVLYPLKGQKAPVYEEVQEIAELYNQLIML